MFAAQQKWPHPEAQGWPIIRGVAFELSVRVGLGADVPNTLLSLRALIMDVASESSSFKRSCCTIRFRDRPLSSEGMKDIGSSIIGYSI